MKRNLFIAIALLFAASISAQQTAQIVLNTLPETEVRYWPLGKGHLNFYTLGTVEKSDANGQFTHTFNISKPTEVKLGVSNAGLITLYLTPGSCDTINLKNDLLEFRGTNSAYNQCLEKVKKYQAYGDSIRYIGIPHELKETASISEFHALADPKMNKILDYVKTSGLNRNFIEEQCTHIDYTNRSIFLSKFLYNLEEEAYEEWIEELKEVLAKPLDSEHFLTYQGTSFFLDGLRTAQYTIIEKRNRDDLINPNLSLEIYKKRISGDNIQHAWANLIYSDIYYDSHTPAIADLYTAFKKEFPNNPYLPTLEPGVNEIIQYNSSVLNKEDYHFLACDSTTKCLEEVVKPFKGKVVYVDIWATWCRPCKEMFQYLPAFKQKAKDMDIEYLYISLDGAKEKEKWEKAIGFYHLKGNHILPDEVLANSIYYGFGGEGGALQIPRFIIVDKEGKVVVRNATGPDEPEKLLEELAPYCK